MQARVMLHFDDGLVKESNTKYESKGMDRLNKCNPERIKFMSVIRAMVHQSPAYEKEPQAARSPTVRALL